MSTRSQIRFMEVHTDIHNNRQARVYQVYRNSDGYPKGVIPDLYDFFKLCVLGEMATKEGWHKAKILHMPQVISLIRANKLYLSHQIENTGEIFGDEEWLYEVNITDAKTPNEILVRYSDNFPKTHAFENAKWSKWYELGALYEKV